MRGEGDSYADAYKQADSKMKESLDSLAETLADAMNKMQDEYDDPETQTDHGANVGMQTVWNDKFDQRV